MREAKVHSVSIPSSGSTIKVHRDTTVYNEDSKTSRDDRRTRMVLRIYNKNNNVSTSTCHSETKSLHDKHVSLDCITFVCKCIKYSP